MGPAHPTVLCTPLRKVPVLRSTVAGLAAACACFACLFVFVAPARAEYYYCPLGLVETGTADTLANGSNCAYWLLPSFPSRKTGVPVPGLDVLPVWQQTQGAGVTVAVIDTGVDPRQGDFATNLMAGWNFFDATADTTDGAAHGTLLASVIAAAAGNGSYVGIAPRATILPVKIMGGPGGSSGRRATPAAAVRYAIDHGARVLNCSWGGLNIDPIPGMANALAAAAKADALVVFSAGNDGVNLEDTHLYVEQPNAEAYGLPNTLTVANFSNTGTLAPDSNYGARHVQIASLGNGLWGDYPNSISGGSVGGTSAAAATVSGVAASCSPPTQAMRPGSPRDHRRRQPRRSNSPADERGGGAALGHGALAALAHPDTAAPLPFRALGPAKRFRLSGRRTVTLRWSPSRDSELEGYKVTFAGRTFIVPPTRHPDSTRPPAGHTTGRSGPTTCPTMRQPPAPSLRAD